MKLMFRNWLAGAMVCMAWQAQAAQPGNAPPPDDRSYLGALIANVDRWRAELPQGTGPHRVVRLIEPDFPEHTVYRPADMRRAGRLPIIAWGNGACRNSSSEFAAFLSEVASHGYFIVAVGRDDLPFDLSPNAPKTSPAGRPMQMGDDRALTTAVDWAVASNARRSSPYFGRLRVDRIAYMGQSCGGIQALTASPDPRTTTTVVLNSGYFRSPPPNPPVVLPPQRKWSEMRAPTVIFTGGPTDVAYQNAKWSYEDGVAAGLPMMLASYPPVGHSGAYAAPDLEWSRVVMSWLDWQLKGDRRARAQFVGARCGLCTNKAWTDVASHGLR